MAWEDDVARGKELGYDLNALAKERNRLKSIGGSEDSLNTIQNKINEIMGSDVQRETTGDYDAFMSEYEVGDNQGPTDEDKGDTVEKALSRRELRQQGRRDRKASRIENLQRKRENLSEAGDAKYERLLSREHRMAKRQQNVGEGARKFRERRDKVMNSMRDSKVGRFFKGNTSS